MLARLLQTLLLCALGLMLSGAPWLWADVGCGDACAAPAGAVSADAAHGCTDDAPDAQGPCGDQGCCACVCGGPVRALPVAAALELPLPEEGEPRPLPLPGTRRHEGIPRDVFLPPRAG